MSIIENLHTPGKEVNKMQDAYHYIQAILSTGHVCRSMIFMIYLSHKTECQICKNQGNKQKKKKPTKTEGNKEKPQILPQLFITCFNLSVVRWKKASWESGTCPPYKIYVTRWGKVRSLHLVAVNVHETPCWRELGNVILFPLSLKFPPLTCGFAQSVPDFRNGASLKAGPGDTHTRTHYNCLFLLLWWPVRAEGSNGAISSAASKGRQMKLRHYLSNY